MRNKKKNNSLNIILFFLVTIIVVIVYFLFLRKIRVTSVILNKNEVKVIVGDSVKLEANVYPSNASNKIVTWYSDDTNIATVNNDGLVTGVKKGETEITVYSENKEIKDVCKVKVVNKGVERINLSKKEFIIQIGETAQIEATIIPDDATLKELKYQSDNESIVEVDDFGKVEAKDLGITYITITDAEELVTAKCKIIVGIPVTKLEIDKKEVLLGLDEENTLSAKITPDDATDKTLTWESDNPEVVSVDATGKIVGKTVGEATITVIDAYKQVTDTSKISVKDIKYTVSFDGEKKIYKRATKLGTLPAPKKENYQFLGWYTAQNGGEKVTAETVVMLDLKLYSQWKSLETFTEGPGQGIYSRTVTYMGRTFKDYKQNRMGAAIEAGGCGPVSLYSILSGYRDDVTIEQIIKISGLSTSFTYINHAARAFGLTPSNVYVYSSRNPNEAAVQILTATAINALKQGKQLIVLVQRSSLCAVCNGLPYDAYSWGNHFIAVVGVKRDGEHVIILNPMESRMEEGRMEDIIRYYLPGGPQSGFVIYSP